MLRLTTAIANTPMMPSAKCGRRINCLEDQLQQALNRIDELEGWNNFQYQRGYNQGCTEGFESTLALNPRTNVPQRHVINKAVNESESSRVICENHSCKSSSSLIFLFSHGSESKSRNQ